MADAGGIGLKLRPQRRRAGDAGRRMEGRFAGEGKASLDLGPGAPIVGERKAEHDRLFGNRAGEDLVIVRQPRND